jgi:catabolite regulation protein CreA
MARYKPYNLKQDKWIPLSYADQIVPGSFKSALNEIVEEHLDLRCGSVVGHQSDHDDPTLH